MSEQMLAPEIVKDFKARALSQPLIENIYTADPSAHVFNGKIYIYPSHDIEAGIPFNDNGNHFDMKDYHVISLDSPQSPAIDNGVALDIKEVPWAKKQMWAPDAAHKDGQYYLYFPAKNYNGLFQIGVAVSDSPTGPFKAEPEPIQGSYSIDPAVFEDDDGHYYMYYGGIWGGQLQYYRNNKYSKKYGEPIDNSPALCPIVVRLDSDMISFSETPRNLQILDEEGKPLLAHDHDRRFFEASWMHKHNGKYYFSYSTGNTHYICYSIGETPYGPFTYAGRILKPVVGWTTHHSICEYHGQWYLFYHDSVLSKGITHLRSIKMAPLTHNADGSIQTIAPYL